MTELISSLKRPVEEDEVRISFNENSADFKKEGASVIEDLKKFAQTDKDTALAPDNYEGVRIKLKGGWILVRMSVHDPVMPINFESDIKGGNKQAAKKLLKVLEAYHFLNVQNLKNFTL